MKPKFEKLANLQKRTEVERKVMDGLSSRQAKREMEYEARAKRHSPNEQFYARSYNL
jgi:hypothetical protein